jgi:hypothetical protein
VDRIGIEALLIEKLRQSMDEQDLGLSLIAIGVGLLTADPSDPAIDHLFLQAFIRARMLRGKAGAQPPEPSTASDPRDRPGPALRLVVSETGRQATHPATAVDRLSTRVPGAQAHEFDTAGKGLEHGLVDGIPKGPLVEQSGPGRDQDASDLVRGETLGDQVIDQRQDTIDRP